jgi:multidrug efflux system membrane fusion protein
VDPHAARAGRRRFLLLQITTYRESKAAPARGAGPAALSPVSVAVTSALKQNVPYYLSGLGTVTAFNTVTVKSRVDGELQKVKFT